MAEILQGNAFDVLKRLPDNHFQTCVTSPPYFGLRDYGIEGQLGLEQTPKEYVEKLVAVFQEVKRVLKDDGTLWLNLGDSYNHYSSGGNGATGGLDKSTLSSKMPPIGTTPVKKNFDSELKPKDLIGIPWRVAFALQADGWYLRQDIIWQKPNPMPESVTDRCTKSHEYIFLLSKSEKYHFDHLAIQEATTHAHEAKYDNGENGHQGGLSHEGQGSSTRKFGANPNKRNRRSVWTVATKPFKGAHFATFPPDLIEPCIKAGSTVGGMVLDPFCGAGTTAIVAMSNGRNFTGIELNPEYIKIAEKRIQDEIGLFQ